MNVQYGVMGCEDGGFVEICAEVFEEDWKIEIRIESCETAMVFATVEEAEWLHRKLGEEIAKANGANGNEGESIT